MITAYPKAVKRTLLACSLTALGVQAQALELVANDTTKPDPLALSRHRHTATPEPNPRP